ncbi:hypothetical protein LCGC14_2954820, partial [marine sediment metagenome]
MCKERQSWVEFYKRGDFKDKEYELCKTCRSKYQKDYYKLHREKCLEASRKNNDRLRLDVLQHYSSLAPHCSLCGESDLLVLNLDHIDGGGYAHRKSKGMIMWGGNIYGYLRKEGYPQGYQTLCMNCQ